MKVHLHFYCVPNKNTQISADTKQLFVHEKLTKKSAGEQKYTELYFHLVECIYRTFRLKSRVSVYAALSKHFPIDELPRRVPSSNQLTNTVRALAISYDGYPASNFDDEHYEHHIDAILLPSKPHIRFIHAAKASSLRTSSKLDGVIPLHSIELYLEKGYHKRARLKPTERSALAKFYQQNIELIKNIRFYAYFLERDITLRLVTRAMSPFWLKASSDTNLEEQSDLIKGALAKADPEGFNFTQHKSRKRIQKNSKPKLIEISLDNSNKIEPNKLYAILLKHPQEGIHIALLDSLNVTNLESDKCSKGTMQPSDWFGLLNKSNVQGDWELHCKYIYKYNKYLRRYYISKIKIQTFAEKITEDNITQEKYKLNQLLRPQEKHAILGKAVYDRSLTPSETQKKAAHQDYINEVDYTIDYKKPLKLNLPHLPGITKEELANLLNEWAKALDTFRDEDLEQMLFPRLKHHIPLLIGKNKPKK